MDWEELDSILKNEKYYRNIIAIHLNESSNNGESLGVQNNNFGNSKERNVINLIENRRYKKALKVINAIDDFMENSPELRIMIFEYKYQQGLYVSQISWKTHYGTTKVKKEIKEIREFFKKRLHSPKSPL